MSTLTTLETLLAKFELYEPELGREFRFSPHLLMLGLGRSELTAWEASALNYFYGPANTNGFVFFANALRLPPKIDSALLKSSNANTGPWWQPTISYFERIERIRVTAGEFELRYADKSGHYELKLGAPALSAERQAELIEWLISGPDLPMRVLARGAPLDWSALQRFELVPVWSSLSVSSSSRASGPLELGVKFLCRALVVYPAHLLIWRGLAGESVIRQFVEGRLSRRKKDFEAAAASLPAQPEAFWAAPDLPPAPGPDDLVPGPGLGSYLPTAELWPRPEENQVFADTLARMYKNVPKKVLKLLSGK